jgi:pyruvate dehydrogenase E2 component (dihydrolipoamide acetyltransferase)
VKVGDKVSLGSLVLLLEVGVAAEAPQAPQATASEAAQPAAAQAAAPATVEVKEIAVPDIGDAADVDVIEVLVAVGDEISADQGLITLETDKATMEVPAPFGGKLVSLTVKVGDKVSQGSVIATVETQGAAPAAVAAPAEAPAQAAPAPAPAPVAAPAAQSRPPVPHHPSAGAQPNTGAVHASPAVRRLAREFGVDLTQVKGTGRKGRILKEDVQAYVKYELSRPKATAATSVGGGSGLQVIDAPKVDFSKFGEVEQVPLTRIQKISGPNLHRNWVTIPHVTQFDEADITEMEAFRKQQNELAAKQKLNVKITPLVFMMKAVAKTLQQFPVFNSSLSPDGESLIRKKYYHIGVAVDTPNGLVVPVVRDVDQKGIIELSRELTEISIKARDGKLKAADMQGSCFTISSLGGIGGTAFTPIVNYPDVAILGVSKSEIKPKWNGKEFEPKLMLPLSLSYDHRVIDGAMAARFSVTLSGILSDIRTMIL